MLTINILTIIIRSTFSQAQRLKGSSPDASKMKRDVTKDAVHSSLGAVSIRILETSPVESTATTLNGHNDNSVTRRNRAPVRRQRRRPRRPVIFLRRCPNAETLSRHESPDCGAKRGITHAQ
ncbi:hypothetical protein EVAR_39919_1 [Eumeta japonica]|uniref:Uncharacterized protein n=1 Tax=Eumeta variegata TaxID=151549 RepID=A0A4C1WNM6_EUMVA|nr:hypothetical protein EVAR_39919_1 [Eumeta japonica]